MIIPRESTPDSEDDEFANMPEGEMERLARERLREIRVRSSMKSELRLFIELTSKQQGRASVKREVKPARKRSLTPIDLTGDSPVRLTKRVKQEVDLTDS
jgi:hypothetical protein